MDRGVDPELHNADGAGGRGRVVMLRCVTVPWLWVKIKPPWDHRFNPCVHLPGFPFRVHIFDPLPHVNVCDGNVALACALLSKLKFIPKMHGLI